MSAFDALHPALQYHVVNSLGWTSLRPTQLEAIEPIHDGLNCLLLAPTAGGKTEAAVIPVLSRMLTENWPGVSVLYVCPIKALLNNLETRLTHYAGLLGRRVEVWHGDVSANRKKKVLANPPDILLTTPESLEGMLVSTKVERQAWFGNLRTVVVDELHAFASDDRGWHLRAVLKRLERYADSPMQRIGLSATVGNPEELLAWFSPTGARRVIGSSSVSKDADVTIDDVGSLDNAVTVIERLHRGQKRLVFCDSRSGAERLSNGLRQLGVRTFVSHASLSIDERRQAETAFAEEKDCVIVATSTLELGIDVGDLDHVIQLDTPTTVSSFLQRMGRTGRRSGSRRNCLFLATSSNALLLTLGVVQKWTEGWVESAKAPEEPWNVAAQQALVLMLEHGQLPALDLISALASAFPELPVDDVRDLVVHMAERGYLFEPAPRLMQIGPEAEKEFARGHYRDLLAVFSGADLLVARHGTVDIGYVDPAVLAGRGEDLRLLLAGRSWIVRDMDWSRRVVWLDEASAGGKARWTGGSRSVGAEVAAAVRTVLERGLEPDVHLSKRATASLQTLRDAIPLGYEAVVANSEKAGRFRMWTFAGTKMNRTRCRQLSDLGARMSDEFSIDFTRDPRSSNTGRWMNTPDVSLNAAEVENLAAALKFSTMLPADLLRRLIMSRLFVQSTSSEAPPET